jgi:hypothetical protein
MSPIPMPIPRLILMTINTDFERVTWPPLPFHPVAEPSDTNSLSKIEYSRG